MDLNNRMTDLEIFHNAPKDASPEELAAYLDEKCGGDADLRAKVEELFAIETPSAEDDFLSESPIPLPSPDVNKSPTDPNSPWEPPSVERLRDLLPQ